MHILAYTEVMRAFIFCAGPAALAGIPPTFGLSAVEERVLSPLVVAMTEARRALRAGDPVAALRGFEGALVVEPRLAIAHLGRAVCLAQLGRAEEAEDALQATFEVSVGQEDVLYQLARMCAAEGQASIAIPLLMESVRAVPGIAAKAAVEPLFRDHPAYLAAIGKL